MVVCLKSAALTSPTQGPRQISRTKSIKQFVEGMDDAAIAKTRELFNLCDADGDGVITKTELFKLVKDLGYVYRATQWWSLANMTILIFRVLSSLEMTKAEVTLLFTTLDVNNDGKLQFKEFMEGMKWLNKGMNVATSREGATPSTASSDASEIALQDALETNKLLLSVRMILS